MRCSRPTYRERARSKPSLSGHFLAIAVETRPTCNAIVQGIAAAVDQWVGALQKVPEGDKRGWHVARGRDDSRGQRFYDVQRQVAGRAAGATRRDIQVQCVGP